MTRLRGNKTILRLFYLSSLSLLLMACTTVSTLEPVEGDDVAQESLDGDLLYQLLVGEFAGVRGELDTAAEYYLEASKVTQDPQVTARAAHIALFAKRYDEALRVADRWQALAKNQDPSIERLRLLVYLRSAQVDKAVASIDQLLQTKELLNDRSVGSLGHILQQEAQPVVALRVLREINKRYRDEPRLLLLQARFEVSAGFYKQALLAVEKVIDLSPEISDAYLIKAQALAAQDKQEASLAAVAMAVEKRPNDGRLRMQYGRMLVQMRHYDEAWKQFNQLREAMPNNENVLLSLGLLSIETGKTDLAKQYLQELIDNGFHNDQAHYYLGRIQQSHGELMPAIANFERVKEGEFLLDAQIRTAGMLAELGKVDDAINKLQMLIKPGQNNPNQIKVYLAQGEVLTNAQRVKEAMRIYTLALKESPENTDLLYARALAAEKLDLLDVAESDLRILLTHEPENANALNALGYTLADRTERLQEAKEYILKAAALLPDDPAILDSLGWVYYRLGQLKESIKWLRKAFARLEDAEIAAHLGEVLWQQGELEDASKIWQRGLEITPDHQILLRTIKRYKP